MAKPPCSREHGFSLVRAQVVRALPSLTGAAVRLAVALGKFADRNDRCHPSIRTLMAVTGIEDFRTFRNARQQLADIGLRWIKQGRRSLRYYWEAPPMSVISPDGPSGASPDSMSGTITDRTAQQPAHLYVPSAEPNPSLSVERGIRQEPSALPERIRDTLARIAPTFDGSQAEESAE